MEQVNLIQTYSNISIKDKIPLISRLLFHHKTINFFHYIICKQRLTKDTPHWFWNKLSGELTQFMHKFQNSATQSKHQNNAIYWYLQRPSYIYNFKRQWLLHFGIAILWLFRINKSSCLRLALLTKD